MKVRVHKGSVLSPLLFIIVLEAKDLYADDLDIIADSLEECVRRLLICKEAMEKKGLRVNAGKTKGHDLCYRPGPLAAFRRIRMRCLSCRRR